MSDELVAFLRACVDEDERVARAASRSGPWRVDPRDQNVIMESTGIDSVGMAGERKHDLFTGQTSNRYGQAVRDVEHIARHDPARVLREVAAKRLIVDQIFIMRPFFTNPEYVTAMEHILRLFASVYADRPGYREEWRP